MSKLKSVFFLCLFCAANVCYSADVDINKKLYFGLTELTKETRAQTVLVPEWFYTTLEDNDPHRKSALIGPLMPCVLIALRNEQTKKAVVFHKHFSNSMASLVQIAQKELNIQDPSQITGIIFTNNYPHYDVPMDTYVGSKSMKDLHEGKTQLQDIKFIKDFIINELKIKDRAKIKACRHTSKYIWSDLGDYPLSFESVLIDSKLEAKNICMIHEMIFCKSADLPFLEKFEIHKNKKAEYVQKVLDKHFGKRDPLLFYTYNCVEFKKINQPLK